MPLLSRIPRVVLKAGSAGCAFGLVAVMFIAAAGAGQDKPAAKKDEKTAPKAEAKTKKVTARDLTLNIPERWKQRQPQSQFRVAEFEVPAAKDDNTNGELVITFFGAGGAGGVAANVQRWIGQFEPEGRKAKIVAGKSPQGSYTLVDLTGTYKKPIGPPMAGKSETMKGWRVINVFLAHEKGAYFLKLDGPAKTIAAAEDEIRAAFGGNANEEKEEKADEKKTE